MGSAVGRANVWICECSHVGFSATKKPYFHFTSRVCTKKQSALHPARTAILDLHDRSQTISVLVEPMVVLQILLIIEPSLKMQTMAQMQTMQSMLPCLHHLHTLLACSLHRSLNR